MHIFFCKYKTHSYSHSTYSTATQLKLTQQKLDLAWNRLYTTQHPTTYHKLLESKSTHLSTKILSLLRCVSISISPNFTNKQTNKHTDSVCIWLELTRAYIPIRWMSPKCLHSRTSHALSVNQNCMGFYVSGHKLPQGRWYQKLSVRRSPKKSKFSVKNLLWFRV